MSKLINVLNEDVVHSGFTFVTYYIYAVTFWSPYPFSLLSILRFVIILEYRADGGYSDWGPYRKFSKIFEGGVQRRMRLIHHRQMEEKTAVDWDLIVLPGNATIRNAKVREMYMPHEH